MRDKAAERVMLALTLSKQVNLERHGYTYLDARRNKATICTAFSHADATFSKPE